MNCVIYSAQSVSTHSQVNCNLLCTVCVSALTASQHSKSPQKPKKNKVTGVIRIQRWHLRVVPSTAAIFQKLRCMCIHSFVRSFVCLSRKPACVRAKDMMHTPRILLENLWHDARFSKNRPGGYFNSSHCETCAMCRKFQYYYSKNVCKNEEGDKTRQARTMWRQHASGWTSKEVPIVPHKHTVNHKFHTPGVKGICRTL